MSFKIMCFTIMDTYRGVRRIVLFGLVLILLNLTSVQTREADNSECEEPWYINVNKYLIITWTGEDRDGTVTANITTKDTYGRTCDSNVTLQAEFKKHEIISDNPCSNALYSVTITVTCGDKKDRKNITVRTPPDGPIISAMMPTNVSITVKWSAPKGLIQMYKVVLIGGRKEKATRQQETKATSWNFPYLEPYTEYEASVMAQNEELWGKAGLPERVRTLEGVPFEPENLVATEVNSEQITLTWNRPEPDTGPILKYEISWTEKGTTENSTEESNNTSYVIKNLFAYTEYTIDVAGVNSVGKGPASSITVVTKLAVPDPPKMEVTGTTNTSISVQWKLTDFYRGPDPTYTVRWKELSEGDLYMSADVEDSSKEGNYTIDDLKPFTVYQVQIRARNQAGLGRWSDIVEQKTLIGVPSAPRNLKVQSKSSFHVCLTWEEPNPANGLILRYMITTRMKQKFLRNDYSVATLFNATDLASYTDYDFKVSAETEAGWGNWTNLLKVRTGVSVPSEPQNLTGEEVTNSTITLQWLAPERKNGPHLDYIVKWAKVEDEKDDNGDVDDGDHDDIDDALTETYSSNISGRDEVNETSYQITDLDPYSNYTVKVCAKTSAGEGKYTEPITIQTTAGIPSSPTSLKTAMIQSTSMMVKWSEPTATNGPLDSYVVHWGVKGTEGSYVKTSAKSYMALGLRPYTEYFFKIAAETEGGRGPFSTLYKRTDISTPSSPTDLLSVSATDHCIQLKWSPPEHPCAPSVRYVVKWKELSEESPTQVHETNSSTFRIRDLARGTNYSIQVCAETSAGQGPWTNMIYVHTKQKNYSSAVIAGSVVVGVVTLVVIVTVILIFVVKKRGGLKHLIKPKTAANACSESVKTTEVSLALDVLHETEKVDVRNFDEHVLKLMSNGYFKLAQEFDRLGKESPTFSTNEAKKNDNLTKNRWVKILPFDHSRVKLRPVGDEVEPDFINASYIPGENYLLEYIATQGPLPNTVNDFWRMVWQESVFLMVMPTQCVERAKRTCERYWPSAGTTMKYGDVEVHTLSESITPAYIQRLFMVMKDGKQRHIVHLHYMNWPVSGCPKSPEDFLHFVKTVRSQISCGVTGPMLVHCSAGIGRTGSFIAVDRLSQRLASTCEEIDIYGTILDLRKYRSNVVQTEEQYYFIHLCIQRIIQEKRQEVEKDYGEGIYSDEF